MKLSKKQIDVLKTNIYDYSYLILVGASSTGKSYVCNLLWYKILCELPPNAQAMICGNTTDSCFKNIVSELLKLDEGIGWIEYTRNPSLIKTKQNAICYVVGVNNEGSDKRIQGGSLEAIYSDEATTYPKSSFDMLSSRLRGEKDGILVVKPMILTLNPDEENHFINTELVQKPNPRNKYWHFEFADNPIITNEFVEQFGSKFAGEFYERMVLGKWASKSDFTVVPEFKEDLHVREFDLPPHVYASCGIDIGWTAKTAYVFGYYDYKRDIYCVIDTWGDKNATTDIIAQNVRDIDNKYKAKLYSRYSDIDQRFIHDIYNQYKIQFYPTRKDNKEGQINALRVGFKNDKILIHPRCKELIKDLKTGKWNKHKDEFETDNEGGHLDYLDALLYAHRNADLRNPYPVQDDGVSISTHHIPSDYYKKTNNKTLETLRKAIGDTDE